jgi:hypothetical protein
VGRAFCAIERACAVSFTGRERGKTCANSFKSFSLF